MTQEQLKSPLRRIVAMIGVFAVVLGLSSVTAPPAAADTPEITVTSLVKSDANGNTEAGALRVGDVAKLSFDWVAVNGLVQSTQEHAAHHPGLRVDGEDRVAVPARRHDRFLV